MTVSSLSPARAVVLRAVVSLGLLAGLAGWLDLGEVRSRVGAMRTEWVFLAIGISVLQVVVSAWRWRFTAGRLGLVLPFRDALSEYYLASFLNQVLPGGVVGDVSRAWRHARTQQEASSGPAIRAVLLERASGQLVMTLVAVVSFLSLPVTVDAGSGVAGIGAAVLATAVLAAGGLVLWSKRRGGGTTPITDRVWQDTRAAFWSSGALPAQMGSSVFVVGTYVATYLLAARAVGVDTPLSILLPLVAPVLVSMLIPVTIAGWGVREATAAVLWGAVGLTAADGVVISVAYGVLVLLSTLPGGLILARAATPPRMRSNSAPPRPSGSA